MAAGRVRIKGKSFSRLLINANSCSSTRIRGFIICALSVVKYNITLHIRINCALQARPLHLVVQLFAIFLLPRHDCFLCVPWLLHVLRYLKGKLVSSSPGYSWMCYTFADAPTTQSLVSTVPMPLFPLEVVACPHCISSGARDKPPPIKNQRHINTSKPTSHKTNQKQTSPKTYQERHINLSKPISHKNYQKPTTHKTYQSGYKTLNLRNDKCSGELRTWLPSNF